MTLTYTGSYIPFTKCHIPCPLLRLYQMISPGPRQMYPFRNKASFYGEKLLAPRQPPSWRTTPCQLLIQYIRSYPPYWRPFIHPQPEDAPCRGDRDPLSYDVTRTVVHHVCMFISIYTSTKVVGFRRSYGNRVFYRILPHVFRIFFVLTDSGISLYSDTIGEVYLC